MKKNKRYFLTGLFVLSGFILFALGCILFGGSELFAKKIYFETYFASSVQGLDVGGSVKFRGVPIGKVESITFAVDTYQDDPAVLEAEHSREIFHSLMYIRVLCSINLKDYPAYTEARLKQMVERGMRASLGMQGITGIVFVNLDYNRDDAIAQEKPLPFVWTPKENYVPSTPTILQNLVDVVEDLGEELRKVNFAETVAAIKDLATNIDQTVSEANFPQFMATLTSLGESLSKQAASLEQMFTALDTEAFGSKVNQLTDNLVAASASMREAIPQLHESTDATLDTMTEALTELKQTLSTVNATLGDLRREIDMNDIGEDTDQTLRALSRTVASLEALVDELREKPSRLIFDDDEE